MSYFRNIFVTFAVCFYNNKNTITQNQLSNNQSLDSEYYNRYQTEYANIQAEQQRQEAIRQWEAEMAEQQRQYNESLAYQKEQDKIAQQQWEKEYALSKSTASARYGSGSGSGILTDGSNNSNENIDSCGNNKETQSKSDYYFKSTTGEDYQPRYIDNTKVSKTGITAGDIGLNHLGKNKNIWTANGKYYVWKTNQYHDVTEEYKQATEEIEVNTMPSVSTMPKTNKNTSKYSGFSYTK